MLLCIFRHLSLFKIMQIHSCCFFSVILLLLAVFISVMLIFLQYSLRLFVCFFNAVHMVLEDRFLTIVVGLNLC